MSNVTIKEFEARNAEAQRINAEIQKAQGALEENKRQFEELCKKYEAEYGEPVNAENIEQIFNRVYSEVAAAAEEQRVALENARNGVIVPTGQPAVEQNTAQAGTAQVGTVQTAQNFAPAGQPVSQTVSQATQGLIDAAQNFAAGTQQGFVAPQQPAPVQQTASPAANPIFGAPTSAAQSTNAVQLSPVGGQVMFGSAEAPAGTQPISASAIPQTAFTAQADIKQPVEQDTSEQIKPAYNIPGWGTANNSDIDFNQVLGGTFGGGQ